MSKRVYKIWVANDILGAYADSEGNILAKADFDSSGGVRTDPVLKALGYEIVDYLIETSEGQIDEILYENNLEFSYEQLKSIKSWILEYEWVHLN